MDPAARRPPTPAGLRPRRRPRRRVPLAQTPAAPRSFPETLLPRARPCRRAGSLPIQRVAKFGRAHARTIENPPPARALAQSVSVASLDAVGLPTVTADQRHEPDGRHFTL